MFVTVPVSRHLRVSGTAPFRQVAPAEIVEVVKIEAPLPADSAPPLFVTARVSPDLREFGHWTCAPWGTGGTVEVVEIGALLPASAPLMFVTAPVLEAPPVVVEQVQPALCRVRDSSTLVAYATPVTTMTAAPTVLPTAAVPIVKVPIAADTVWSRCLTVRCEMTQFCCCVCGARTRGHVCTCLSRCLRMAGGRLRMSRRSSADGLRSSADGRRSSADGPWSAGGRLLADGRRSSADGRRSSADGRRWPPGGRLRRAGGRLLADGPWWSSACGWPVVVVCLRMARMAQGLAVPFGRCRKMGEIRVDRGWPGVDRLVGHFSPGRAVEL